MCDVMGQGRASQSGLDDRGRVWGDRHRGPAVLVGAEPAKGVL